MPGLKLAPHSMRLRTISMLRMGLPFWNPMIEPLRLAHSKKQLSMVTLSRWMNTALMSGLLGATTVTP